MALTGLSDGPGNVRRREMDDTTKPLIALGFVFLVLAVLMLVNPSFDKSLSVFANSVSTVSELGLRFSFQR
jgi:hypothetical protein